MEASLLGQGGAGAAGNKGDAAEADAAGAEGEGDAGTAPAGADVLLLDFNPDDTAQLNSARRVQRRARIPSLVLIPEFTIQREALLRREGFTLIRRRPDVRAFTTEEGRAPLLRTLYALRRTSPAHYRAVAAEEAACPGARSGLRPSAEVGGTTRHVHVPSRRPGTIIVIGASTGGPQAIRAVIQELPEPIPVPVAIVQHISHGFSEGFARWLRETAHRDVSVATGGEELKPDSILVAPSGLHMTVQRNTVELNDGERRQFQKPSVDILFESAASSYGKGVIAVLLTGMGRDGAEGCVAVHRAGGTTIIQNETTSVVYGMPRAAVEAQAATEILPLDQIGSRVSALLARQALQMP